MDTRKSQELPPQEATGTAGGPPVTRAFDAALLKPGDEIDTDQLADGHALLYKGKLTRKATGVLGGWTDVTGYIFDNCFVIATSKETDGVAKDYVDQRPVRLELLELGDFNEPVAKKNRFSFRKSFDGKTDEGSQDGALYPFTIEAASRGRGQLRFYTGSDVSRLEWKEKFEDGIKLVQGSPQTFYLKDAGGDAFKSTSKSGASLPCKWDDGEPTCTVRLVSGDREIVAVGRSDGVWFGLVNDPDSLRRVLHLTVVTQLAVLPEHGMFLVLADKSLFVYRIDDLAPPIPDVSAPGTPQKLNGSKDVQFFTVGRLEDRTFVIYVKKKGLDSVFRVLEPIVDLRTEGAAPKQDGKSREWFRVHRDFFLANVVHDVLFLKSKLAILCRDGTEVMDLTDFKSVTIPQRDDPTIRSLKKKYKFRPLTWVRVDEDTFLICYEEFGLYVNRHGDPLPNNPIVEWEGTIQHVAVHHPYILLFDDRFIEIRDRVDGHLVQIIRSKQVRGLVTTPVNIRPLTPEEDGYVIWTRSGIYATVVDAEDTLEAKVFKRRLVQVVPTADLEEDV